MTHNANSIIQSIEPEQQATIPPQKSTDLLFAHYLAELQNDAPENTPITHLPDCFEVLMAREAYTLL
ncbi:MAG: hypothetical protein IPJ94_11545 [Chloroflexi bacterium]|nr:hypothetical protein [Chloroflexota bacterium]